MLLPKYGASFQISIIKSIKNFLFVKIETDENKDKIFWHAKK